MQMHLDNGEKRTVRVIGSTYGFRVTGVTLDFGDVCNLLNMKDGELRDYLGVLFTRFAPPDSPQPAQQEHKPWCASLSSLMFKAKRPCDCVRVPLPTAPSSAARSADSAEPFCKPWVGLNAKDLAEIPSSCFEGAIWADAKLREKNAGGQS